jgi:hypothetical protein
MPHRVPLSPLALALLDEIEVATGRRADPGREGPPRCLFPAPCAGKPITGPAVDHAMRDNRSIPARAMPLGTISVGPRQAI